MCTAFTVRPWSAPATGVCSLRTNVTPSTLTVVSWTDAVAVDAPGLTLVVTLAHNVCALIKPPIVSTHGGATVVAAAVATEPVSGTREIDGRFAHTRQCWDTICSKL